MSTINSVVAAITRYSDLLWTGRLGDGIPLGGPGVHPASCIMGATSFCLWASGPSSTEVKEKSRAVSLLFVWVLWFVEADSHVACRAHAVPLPCSEFRQSRVLRESPRGSRKYPNCQSNSLTDRPFCSVLLPLLTVVGMDRCEDDWYASDNNLCGTPRGGRKKPNVGR